MVLEADECSSGWSNVESLRRCTYILWALVVLFFLGFFLPRLLLEDYFADSVTATRIYRCFMLVISLGWIILTAAFTYFYYRYILSKGGQIYFQNIFYFYMLSVIFFGFSYFYLYLLFPYWFTFDSPVPVSPTFMMIPRSYITNFILFSAFQSVNGSYFRIRANSALVSLLTYFQAIYTISLIALFVASYVNQKTSKGST